MQAALCASFGCADHIPMLTTLYTITVVYCTVSATMFTVIARTDCRSTQSTQPPPVGLPALQGACLALGRDGGAGLAGRELPHREHVCRPGGGAGEHRHLPGDGGAPPYRAVRPCGSGGAGGDRAAGGHCQHGVQLRGGISGSGRGYR